MKINPLCIIAQKGFVSSFHIAQFLEQFFYFQKLLPCGKNPNPVRTKIENVNSKLQDALQGLPNTQLVDIDPGFILPDGTISHHDMYDYLHLTRSAYSKSFEILYDLLQQILIDNTNLPEAE